MKYALERLAAALVIIWRWQHRSRNQTFPHVLLLLQEQLTLPLDSLVLALLVLVRIRGLLQAHGQVLGCGNDLRELVLH